MKLIVIVLLLIFLVLSEYLLKKKLKPNEDLLDEIKDLEISRKINIAYIILIAAIVICLENYIYFTLLTILIPEFFRCKYSLKYLNDKNESESTKQYILNTTIIQYIYVILLVIYLFFFNM
ncbi:hypothetical protein [Romboutsia lituseburensis]|uniref:hypothetical protein n=1 Tax=Romboutsia lituseburensis TaxID=1537 RepID=UPI0022EA2665|nr:hypothetical protein [Romboutsia lituseburensis]